MKLKHATYIAIIAAGLMGTVLGSAHAATISVNLGPANDNLDPTEVAGVSGFAASNYNNVTSTLANLILNDDSGAQTTATLTVPMTTSFGAITGFAPFGPDETLNRSSVFGNFADFSLTLSSIPYANYSIVVYSLAQEGDLRSITVDGTTFHSHSPGPSASGFVDFNPATPYLYTLATSTDVGSPTRDSNYVLFTGLTGPNQTIFVSGDSQRSVSGFQIVQVIPEPSIGAILLAILIPVGFRKRPCPR